ncbi:MAG: hypothetical protein GX605_11410, partial [Chloroflexi bacterium]|nr:hypothetical protein [Chloroflexota bacterium]
IRFRRAAAPEPAASGPKTILHYVLFGPPERPETQADLCMAVGYLLRFAPTFGFSPDEALHADLVAIVGGEEAVSAAAEEHLRAAGCRVFRVAGASREVDARLTELEERGTPFPDA